MKHVAIAVFLIALPSAAKAQTQPTSQSPFWKEELPATGRDAQASDVFPTQLVAAVPSARANAVQLQLVADEADRAVEARQEAITQREQPAVDAAERDVRQAAIALTRARSEAISSLADNPDYIAVGTLADRMDRQIEQLHADNASPSASMIDTMAREALYYDQQQSNLEREVLSNSEAVADAKATFEAATRQLQDAKIKLSTALRTDGELAALERAAAVASADATAAFIYARSAEQAADLAIDFARRAASQPRTGGYGGYGGYGGHSGYGRYDAGYGFGYGFEVGSGFIRVPVVSFVGNSAISNTMRNTSSTGRPIISNVVTNR